MIRRKNLGAELAALGQHLQAAQGKQYWRSLEELAGSEAFREVMRREFPEQADVWPDALSRRQFLTLMGASLALAGLSGCSVKPAPSSDMVPYVHPPEDVVPGRPLFFATAMTFAGSAVGLLVESHAGRPTKVEGNPDHPASLRRHRHLPPGLGADALRPRPLPDGHPPGPDAHLGRGAGRHPRRRCRSSASSRGAGLRLLTETIVSPTLARANRSPA